MTHQSIIKIATTCVLPGAAVFAAFALAGCETDTRTTVVYRQSSSNVIVDDDYVYYPQYQMYYSNRRHEYGYQDGSNWVWRSTPTRVNVNVLVSTPSVHLDFHDSPAQHHAEVVRKYPTNWKQADKNAKKDDHKNAKKDDHKNDRKDDHKDDDRQH